MIAIIVRTMNSKQFKEWLKSQGTSFSFTREPGLFSPAERSFLGVIEQVLGTEYRVFGKVRIADLMKPANGIGRQAAFNRITGKHVDFVICDAKALSIIGVIELDDKSHKQDKRKRRDAFVDEAFASAGIPIAHFPARAAYSLVTVRDSIQQVFNLNIKESEQSKPSRPSRPPKVIALCDFNDANGPDSPDNDN
jgi:very-short-patch-repair endonuclease